MHKSRESSLSDQGIMKQITYIYSIRLIYNGAGLGSIFNFHKTQILWSQNFTLVRLVQARRFDVKKKNGKNKLRLGNLCFTPVGKYYYSE